MAWVAGEFLGEIVTDRRDRETGTVGQFCSVKNLNEYKDDHDVVSRRHQVVAVSRATVLGLRFGVSSPSNFESALLKPLVNPFEIRFERNDTFL